MNPLSSNSRGAGKFLPALVLTLLCFGLYAGSLSAPWHLDDMSFIAHDPAVQQLWPIGGHPNRPVLMFSLALNNALCGLDPACFRFANILIHAGTAVLLFSLIARLLGSGRLGAKAADSAQGLAFSVAALWMVHPIHTMAVTYVWQRSESMMGLFFVATLYAVLRCAEGARSKVWGAAAIVFCLLGLGTKEVMVAVIPVALVFDAILLAPSLREAVKRRWALHGSLALILLALIAVVGPRTSASNGELGNWTYAANQPGVVLDYLRLSVWPWPLCFDYDRQPAQGMMAILLPAIPIIAALLATLWGLFRRSWMGVAGAVFFCVLAPTSSFVEINDLMVEYRLYLPLIAPVCLLVALSRIIWDRWNPQVSLRVLFGVVLCALSVATILRNQDYSTSVSLWSSVVETAPDNARGENSCAASYLELEEPKEALKHSRRAVELDPDYYSARVNLGTALKWTGDMEGALEEFKQAVRIKPQAKPRIRLGNLLLEMEMPGKAEKQFKLVLAKRPGNEKAAIGLAHARMDQDKHGAAEKVLSRLVEKNPEHGQAWYLLGLSKAALELPVDAATAFERAVAINDKEQSAWIHLARLSIQLRRLERAAQAYGRAVELDPKDLRLQLNHGRALVAAGLLDEAESVLTKLLKQQPSMAREVGNLASKLARGDALNKQTARALGELAVSSTRRRDHVTMLHMARVHAYVGEPGLGLQMLDEILALPAVQADPKLKGAYLRERSALEQHVQGR